MAALRSCVCPFRLLFPSPANTTNQPFDLDSHSGPPSASRRGAAAHHIQGECERFCCETLQAVFLHGEKGKAAARSLGLDARIGGRHRRFDRLDHHHQLMLLQEQQLPTIPELACSPSESGSDDSVYDGSSVYDGVGMAPAVDAFLEIWDYSGGSRFRGFVAERRGSKGLFIFFDEGAFGHDLKAGWVDSWRWGPTANGSSLMALLELCSLDELGCTELVICLDRDMETADLKSLMKDLGWVGFSPTTLIDWAQSQEIISSKWVFLAMDV